jgi:transcriptional regulator with XRE-family HTH domain
MPRQITPTDPPASPEIKTLADLGAFVRSQRTRQGLRIDDAAALCRVSVQLLSDLENGRRSVRLDNALAVAHTLGLALLVTTRDQLPRAAKLLSPAAGEPRS